mmetsp:Transcript_30147/g.99705  ORF Transcript_30147/g.99705 Transcript_30147/m.99705 type:complete len:88 (-) Transcript_30147:244-507(-)
MLLRNAFATVAASAEVLGDSETTVTARAQCALASTRGRRPAAPVDRQGGLAVQGVGAGPAACHGLPLIVFSHRGAGPLLKVLKKIAK